MAKKIVVVGSLIVDLTTYVDRYPVTGETVLGTPAALGPGGKGNNQATAACKTGSDVTMIGKVGTDVLASLLENHCRTCGMNCDHLLRAEGEQSGAALIEVLTTTGDNRIIVGKGANELLTAAEVEAADEAFAACDLVLTQLETSMESIQMAKDMAKKYGKTFVLNPAPAQPLPEGYLDGVDYFTPNETEAAFYVGAPVETDEQLNYAGQKLLDMGVKHVVITLGSRGAFYMDSERSVFVPSFKVDAIDTTGAGDAFNGGFVTALAEGQPIEDVIRFGCATAGISVTRKGTAPAMPTREEVEAFLKANA